MSHSKQSQGVVVTAKVFPRCECGRPFGAHLPDGCNGYVPSGDVKDLGTRAYVQPAARGFWRSVACAILWGVERTAQRWRERLER